MLSVKFDAMCPGPYNDVDYHFIVVAKNYNNEVVAKFGAGGS